MVSTYELDLGDMTAADWPDASSTGYRSGAGVWMGAPWGLVERATVGTAHDPIPHTVGGTGFQSVAPSREYVLATHWASFDDACPDVEVEVVESGAFQPGDTVWDDADDGTFGASEALLRFDPDTQDWTVDSSTPDFDGRHYTSAAAMRQIGCPRPRPAPRCWGGRWWTAGRPGVVTPPTPPTPTPALPRAL